MIKNIDYTKCLSFFNVGMEYCEAGNILFDINPKIKHPLYFIFSHSLELLLKSYINTIKYYNKHEHELDKLVEIAKNNRLHLPPETEHIVKMIQSENKVHGFRYFNFSATGIPVISYYKEFVNSVATIVSESVQQVPKSIDNRVIFKIKFGKPEQK